MTTTVNTRQIATPGGLATTHIIPIQELTPGQIGTIRNLAIEETVKLATTRLNISRDRLVVRDLQATEDLELYSSPDVTGTRGSWAFDCTAASGAWVPLNPETVMQTNRWVVIFGIRDLRMTYNDASNFDATACLQSATSLPARFSLYRVVVGGAVKVEWDLRSIQAYSDAQVGFTPSPLIIIPNVQFRLYAYNDLNADGRAVIQLIGVTVEPRGVTISP